MLAPSLEKLDDYYKTYWKYLEGDDLLLILNRQTYTTSNWLNGIPEKIQDHVYMPGKWMLKEVVGHLCDTERILSYRALCFSRNEKKELPGFDENAYMLNSNYKSRQLSDIIEEWKAIRTSSICLFSSMDDEAADREGIANGATVTPRILLYFILMHERHHAQVMKDRYLLSSASI